MVTYLQHVFVNQNQWTISKSRASMSIYCSYQNKEDHSMGKCMLWNRLTPHAKKNWNLRPPIPVTNTAFRKMKYNAYSAILHSISQRK
jgi:hypothetical protein